MPSMLWTGVSRFPAIIGPVAIPTRACSGPGANGMSRFSTAFTADNAARIARSGSSSVAIGQPKPASTLSPRYSATCPPC